MVGRGFGVVMAFSFCFAPLHAVRLLAQPPQGADLTRSSRSCFGPADAGSLLGRIPRYVPPRTLRGYRPQGCQVSENSRYTKVYAAELISEIRLRKHLPQQQ